MRKYTFSPWLKQQTLPMYVFNILANNSMRGKPMLQTLLLKKTLIYVGLLKREEILCFAQRGDNVVCDGANRYVGGKGACSR